MLVWSIIQQGLLRFPYYYHTGIHNKLPTLPNSMSLYLAPFQAFFFSVCLVSFFLWIHSTAACTRKSAAYIHYCHTWKQSLPDTPGDKHFSISWKCDDSAGITPASRRQGEGANDGGKKCLFDHLPNYVCNNTQVVFAQNQLENMQIGTAVLHLYAEPG